MAELKNTSIQITADSISRRENKGTVSSRMTEEDTAKVVSRKIWRSVSVRSPASLRSLATQVNTYMVGEAMNRALYSFHR